MAEIRHCSVCNTAQPGLTINSKYYCDKYCLYIDDPTNIYLDVPQGEKDRFDKLAHAQVTIKAAQAQLSNLEQK